MSAEVNHAAAAMEIQSSYEILKKKLLLFYMEFDLEKKSYS